MTAIFECLECGHHAVYEQEDGLTKCPKCDDIHVDVTYGVPSYETRAQVAKGAADEIERVDAKYQELIMEVQSKYPGESRHETAKRYIHERENRQMHEGTDRRAQPERRGRTYLYEDGG